MNIAVGQSLMVIRRLGLGKKWEQNSSWMAPFSTGSYFIAGGSVLLVIGDLGTRPGGGNLPDERTFLLCGRDEDGNHIIGWQWASTLYRNCDLISDPNDA